MYKIFPRSIWIALLMTALFAGGCSDFDEMKGQKLFNRAETLLQDGDEVAAEMVLAELVAKYPRTQAGEKGQKQLLQVTKHREKREQQAFGKILQSYQQVINGYHSMFAEYPSSIEALDQNGYFFDGEYLAEITPEGFQAYLWFAGDNTGYRVWCVKDDGARGYTVAGQDRKLTAVDREELRAELDAKYQKVSQLGNLTVLVLR